MNLLLVFSFVLFGFSDNPDFSTSLKTTKFTLPINDRIAILKHEIADQIRSKHVNFEENEETRLNEQVDYVYRDNEPITPISEHDPRKKKQLFKMKEMKTTRAVKVKDAVDRKAERANTAIEKPREKPILKTKKMKLTDVFYRRTWMTGAHKWTHCQSLITPYLLGHKTNITVPKRVPYDDHVVIRLLQLLSEDVAGHTKDDIHSILYQISNLQLRLFQWDVAAMKLLFNVIHKDKERQSFKGLKYGLKKIFDKWNLHFGSNISVLIKQTRIFRPACIRINDYEGSTQTSKAVRYSKSTQKKKICPDDDDYDECQRRNNH